MITGKPRMPRTAFSGAYAGKRITSASAMVFMEDSERAAALASQTSLEVGLHLNFTMPFSAPGITPDASRAPGQGRLLSDKKQIRPSHLQPFSGKSRLPILFNAQQEEFTRLYGRNPDFYNGHHHMHLCANVLAGKLIPKGARVRRTFTFEQGEKDPFNRLYRRYLNGIISTRFTTTDRFYSIVPRPKSGTSPQNSRPCAQGRRGNRGSPGKRRRNRISHERSVQAFDGQRSSWASFNNYIPLEVIDS